MKSSRPGKYPHPRGFQSPASLRLLRALLTSLAFCASFETFAQTPARPNVLFIAVDDLKPVLGAYGDRIAVTPHLDKLAASGRLFTGAYCQFAVCSPSRVSLLTGLRPDTAQIQDLHTFFRDRLPGIVTLPQHFGAQGYTVSGIGKIYHGPNPQNHEAFWQDAPASWNHGWTESTANPKRYFEPGKSEAEDAILRAKKAPFARVSLTDRSTAPEENYLDAETTQKALGQLTERARALEQGAAPFFLAVGYSRPHLPFNAPDKYWRLYDHTDFGLQKYTGTRDDPAGGVSSYAAPPFPGEFGNYTDFPKGGISTPAKARELVQGYYACVSFIDAQIGRLLASLDELKLADNTIVVVWSDHGFHLGDHNGYWAKHSNFEQATRTPLIFRIPRDRLAGQKVERLVELVDIYPTLIDLAGLPAPQQPEGLGLQGRSLWPLFENPSASWDERAFSQFTREGHMGYSVRTPRYRYTVWSPLNAAPGNPPHHEELYDYVSDPAETRSFAADPAYKETLTEMRAKLDGGHGWKTRALLVPAAP
jgi:iduronate 2-sulfatase